MNKKVVAARRRKILVAIQDKQLIRAKHLAEDLGIELKVVWKDLYKMQEKGLISAERADSIEKYAFSHEVLWCLTEYGVSMLTSPELDQLLTNRRVISFTRAWQVELLDKLVAQVAASGSEGATMRELMAATMSSYPKIHRYTTRLLDEGRIQCSKQRLNGMVLFTVAGAQPLQLSLF